MVPWSRAVPAPRSPHYANWVAGVAGAPVCFCGASMCPWSSNSFRRLSTCLRYRPPLLPAISPVSPPSAAVYSSSMEITARPNLRTVPPRITTGSPARLPEINVQRFVRELRIQRVNEKNILSKRSLNSANALRGSWKIRYIAENIYFVSNLPSTFLQSSQKIAYQKQSCFYTLSYR